MTEIVRVSLTEGLDLQTVAFGLAVAAYNTDGCESPEFVSHAEAWALTLHPREELEEIIDAEIDIHEEKTGWTFSRGRTLAVLMFG